MTSRLSSASCLATVLGLAAAGSTPAEACDRPAIRPAQRLGRADLAVHVRVRASERGTAVVEPVRVLFGPPPAGPFSVLGVAEEDAPLRCGGTPLAAGKEYLLFLFRPRPGETAPRLIDSADGVVPLPSALGDELTRLARSAAPAPWTAGPDGLEVKLYASAPAVGVEEDLDLYVLVRNVGAVERTLRRHTWPPERHAFCTLAMSGKGGVVAPVDVPIAKADIADYFSKHGPRHEVILRPSEVHEIFLPRVTTAKPGWGYKEELGFRYYPAEPGRYQLRARCERLLPSTLEAGPIDVVLER